MRFLRGCDIKYDKAFPTKLPLIYAGAPGFAGVGLNISKVHLKRVEEYYVTIGCYIIFIKYLKSS